MAELLKRTLMSQVRELFRKPRTVLKILYFSGIQEIFQKLPGIKFLHDRERELFHLLTGSMILDRGGAFSKIIDWGRHWSSSHQGPWTECIKTDGIYC